MIVLLRVKYSIGSWISEVECSNVDR